MIVFISNLYRLISYLAHDLKIRILSVDRARWFDNENILKMNFYTI